MLASVDNSPWEHPFLTDENLRRFRSFSASIWQLAAESRPQSYSDLDIAFANNMAQNMYKWARLSHEMSVNSSLYLNPQDTSAINRPEWEEFDGEHEDVQDGTSFLANYDGPPVEVRCREPRNEGARLLEAYRGSVPRTWLARKFRAVLHLLSPVTAERLMPAYRDEIDHDAVARLQSEAPFVRADRLLEYSGFYSYYEWAAALSEHDVCYIAGTPFPAFASGKPYCVCPVGGDLQYDCGRADELGRAMRDSFRTANFVLVSNPHVLGHCRRLGITRALYLPYPMDTHRYCPGEAQSRSLWEERYGGETYILVTARIDGLVKGFDDSFFAALQALSNERDELRFVFLGWGEGAKSFKRRIQKERLSERMIILPPVGKQRLIDYYRSSDIVLDQLAYGYYGASAMEAASVGKPVVMHMREAHYSPLYQGDLAPIDNAKSVEQVVSHLKALADDPILRIQRGSELRDWLIRQHGFEKTMPILLDILALAAAGFDSDSIPDNPLCEPFSADEIEYHRRCENQAS